MYSRQMRALSPSYFVRVHCPFPRAAGVTRMDDRNLDIPAQGADSEDAAALQFQLLTEFEFSPEGQFFTDGHGLILRANQAAAILFQSPKEFLIGKPLGLFVANGRRPRFYDCLSRLWQGAAGDSFDTEVKRRTGDFRDVILSVYTSDGGEGRASSMFRWYMRDITDLRRAEAARIELLRRLVTTQEEERRRVSRELHDSIGQLLSALSLAVKTVRETDRLPPMAVAKLASVQQIADDLGRAAHDLAIRLRPTALDDIGLYEALSQFLTEWSARTGIEIEFEATAVAVERLQVDVETAVFRVVQEAMTNIARHAKAGRASVAITRHESQVTVVVEDDGVGFNPEAVPSGRLGLIGMRERVALANGTLEIESSPGHGATVLARFPAGGRTGRNENRPEPKLGAVHHESPG